MVCLILAAVCWTALRFEYTNQFAPSSYDCIYDFTAAVPFGKRVLMPLLAHLVTKSGLGVIHAFEVLEIVSVIMLCLGLSRTFKLYGNERMSRFLGAGIMFVLPWLFLVPCHYSLLFPWDLPAMAFTAWGIWAALTGRWGLMCGLMVFASCNRESAVLLPGIWVAICLGKQSLLRTVGMVTLLGCVYVLVQASINPFLNDNLDFYELTWGMSMKVHGTWRLLNNWNWLSECGQRVFVWLGTMSCLPVLFGLGVKKFPIALRRCGLVAWGYFWMLMVVGNIYEARVFGEITVLLYVPVALWIWQRTTGEKLEISEMKGWSVSRWLEWVEIGCGIGVAAGVVLLGCAFSQGWIR